MKRWIVGALLALLVAGLSAQEQNGKKADVRCGTEWITFTLPGFSEEERKSMGPTVANRATGTALTIRKRDVRNVVFYSDTKGGEVVFKLEVAHPERDKVIYSGIVTEAVYLGVVACLD